MEEMYARFVNIDHDSPVLLPPDLRDWVTSDHMVHFVMDAVKALDLSLARMTAGQAFSQLATMSKIEREFSALLTVFRRLQCF